MERQLFIAFVPSVIEFLSGSMEGRSFPVNGPLTYMGTDPANNHIVIVDPSVRRLQVRLIWHNGLYMLESRWQDTMVTVNGQTRKQTQTILNYGDIIGLDVVTTFRIRIDTQALLAARKATPSIDPEIIVTQIRTPV
jgi:hypothetical protein